MTRLVTSLTMLVAASYGAYLVLAVKDKQQIQWISVTEEKIQPTFSERGIIVPSKVSLVQTSTAGTILFMRTDGEKVNKGDVLVKIDTSNYADQIAALDILIQTEELALSLNKKKAVLIEKLQSNKMLDRQKKYQHAVLVRDFEFNKPDKDELRKLAIDHELKTLDLEEARSNLGLQTNLFNKGFVSEASLDPFKRSYETALEKVKKALLDIETTKKGIAEERRVELEQNVIRRQADLDRATKRMKRKLVEINDIIKVSQQKIAEHSHKKKSLIYKLNNSICYAAADGYFRIKRFYDWRSGGQYSEYTPGITVRERDVMAEIVDPARMRVDVIFNEADLHKLKPGLKVEVTLPAYEGKKFFGTLERVGAIGKDRNLWLEELTGTSGVSMFNAAVSFDSEGVNLHPGMSAMVKVFMEAPSRGLVIPRKALLEEEGRFYVLTASSKVELQGRFIDEFNFEVFEGLKSGDKVQALHQEGT